MCLSSSIFQNLVFQVTNLAFFASTKNVRTSNPLYHVYRCINSVVLPTVNLSVKQELKNKFRNRGSPKCSETYIIEQTNIRQLSGCTCPVCVIERRCPVRRTPGLRVKFSFCWLRAMFLTTPSKCYSGNNSIFHVLSFKQISEVFEVLFFNPYKLPGYLRTYPKFLFLRPVRDSNPCHRRGT